nr:MAG: hypothetical protein 2 [Leviviridae sp.]
MFTDTLTISINAVDKTLTRINQDGYSSEYRLREDTGEYSLRIRHSSYVRAGSSIKVDRHNVELIHTVYGTEAGAPNVVRKTYTVFENDAGDSLADAENLVSGCVAFLTEANIAKMLNWES